jgi:transposase InsO family protein
LVDKRSGAEKHIPRKLTLKEENKIIDISNSLEYRDNNPHEIVALLLEKGTYIASTSTFYRVLNKNHQINHRTNAKPRQKRSKPPQKIATGPNQVWCWDITWLKTDVRGIYHYAYVITDIYDRSIVGWEIHDREESALAVDLFDSLTSEFNLKGVHLHSDNGAPMRGSSLLAFLNGLEVTNSFNRPRTSNDNAYIESFFRTLKYSPGYPNHFKSIEDSRYWMADFIDWYNNYHLHSAIGYVTPNQKRSGKHNRIYKKRNKTLEKAKKLNPGRWGSRKTKEWIVDNHVILNKDKDIA